MERIGISFHKTLFLSIIFAIESMEVLVIIMFQIHILLFLVILFPVAFVYEAVFVLDGIINNTSNIQPHKIYGDTHAQNEAIFGLSYLLGIQLMSRIRSLKELNFYKIENLDTLFTKTINWSLIQRYYMMICLR